MDEQTRHQIALGRSTHYFGIMQTVFLTYLGIAAVLHLGPGGYSAPLTMLTVSMAAYGILAGGAALDDLQAVRKDMGAEIAETSFGKTIAARNVGALKTISNVLTGLTGVALLYEIFV